VQLRDGAIDAGGQAEIVCIDDEPAHGDEFSKAAGRRVSPTAGIIE
jgi:hypothetical protein